jgi:hypothetical protein
MDLRTVRVSDTVTRYFVEANLDPGSRVLLVRPSDGVIITGWCTPRGSTEIKGEWISPYPDLIAAVRGVDFDEPASTNPSP